MVFIVHEDEIGACTFACNRCGEPQGFYLNQEIARHMTPPVHGGRMGPSSYICSACCVKEWKPPSLWARFVAWVRRFA